MFTQIFIVAMGVMLIVSGVTQYDLINVVLGVLVAGAAGSALYKLKTGQS